MQVKAGQVFITQGDPKSIISWVIKWATQSWWTHGFVTVSETEAIEAVFPRVCRLNIQDRLNELAEQHRDYVVMDLPGITDEQRKKVAQSALAFEGRLYDIWNCLYYAIFKIWVEGGKRLVCSRLMAASFFDALRVRIFDGAEVKLPSCEFKRLANLEDGYCTPDEVFRYSELIEVYRHKENCL